MAGQGGDNICDGPGHISNFCILAQLSIDAAADCGIWGEALARDNLADDGALIKGFGHIPRAALRFCNGL